MNAKKSAVSSKVEREREEKNVNEKSLDRNERWIKI